MATSILGTSVIRLEDPAFLTGATTYIDNLDLSGVLHLAFVRSTVALGRILSFTTDQAWSMPGVVGVFRAEDLNIPPHHAFMATNEAVKRPPLATGMVHFVGDPVAVVVARTKSEAVDAAETVIVDYDVLPAQVDMEQALAADAVSQYDTLVGNLMAGFRDPQGDSVLADAEVVVRGRFENQRIAVVPMEGNAIAVLPGDDGNGHDITVYVSTQMPHMFQRLICAVFGTDPDKMRVITPNVGGGFGGKAGVTAEHSVAVAVARRLERPVKWVETRTENMQALPHGRGQVQYVEMGFTRAGKITGLRARIVGDAGAYAGFGGNLVIGPTVSMAQGVYDIPKISIDAAVALTTTTPMGAFRGAGRPEATCLLERIMDLAADELGVDPAELRRGNLLQPQQFPYTTLTGRTYDVGRYEFALDAALKASDYTALLAEQTERRERGDRVQMGIGISTYVEITAGGGGSEFGAVDIAPDGSATIRVGTSGHGQGHPTSFAMIVNDQLGIPLDKIHFVQSDTAEVPRGSGTGGSRSLQLGGTAVQHAAVAVLERAKRLAATALEANVEDIVVHDDGKVGVAGVPASALSWSELAAHAAWSDDGPLGAELDVTQSDATFPFGSHVAVVDVDMETGYVRLRRHIAVDDAGRILNPMLVNGQQHGGIAQGVAQALWEQFVYDDNGNPLTSTLAEYAMPSAAEFPSFEVSNTETPTPLNSLGAKGIGESGTIGSMPAVHNAVVDAVSHLGVRHIDMPCTPERVWQAITDAAVGTLPDPWREPPAFFATLPLKPVAAAASTQDDEPEADI
jgi:aerobic carbon-monoxide dehydrogenase large subunit